MIIYKALLLFVWLIAPYSIVNASLLFETVFKTPEHYYYIQYGYSGSTEDVKKWTTNNSYFLTLNLKEYSEENLYEQYLLNYELEGEIRKMLSFLGNIQIDKVHDSFEDQMLKTFNTLHKSEKGYLPNEEQFIDYFIEKKPELLSLLYIELLRKSRELGYPINKESGNWRGKWEEPYYMNGKKPYDLYIENRNFGDYYQDYKSYFIIGIIILVGALGLMLFNIFHKIHHHSKKSLEKSDTKLENSNDKIDSWSEFSKGDKVALYILALIIPPLLIGLLSIPFFEEPIIIKNPWVDSILFYGLIKLYFTRKYNHIITAGLIIILIWHVFINILLTSQL